MNNSKSVSIIYTNYKGETTTRTIVPLNIFFGSNMWHEEEQWLLTAIDVGKNAERTFAIKDIKKWIV